MKKNRQELFFEEELRQHEKFEKFRFGLVIAIMMLMLVYSLVMLYNGIEEARGLGLISIIIIVVLVITSIIGKRER